MRVITHGDFSERFAVVVQPLRGKGRIIVRTGPNDEATAGEYQPQWSPNGRWIAYVNLENAQRRRGLTLVRPNGKGRHRAVLGADEEMAFRWSPDGGWLALMEGLELDYVLPSGAWHRISAHASGPPSWSPDGKKLAFPFYREQGEDIAIASGNGRKPKLLHLGVGSVSEQALVWSPDGRWIAFGGSAGGDPRQAWIVGADGRGLRRLTSEGDNDPVSWTRLAPVLPPAAPIPPGEHVVAADTVATTSPVTALAADGQSVVFLRRRLRPIAPTLSPGSRERVLVASATCRHRVRVVPSHGLRRSCWPARGRPG